MACVSMVVCMGAVCMCYFINFAFLLLDSESVDHFDIYNS